MNESIYGKIDDGVHMLDKIDIPLNSFSIIGIFGARGSGKTTKQNQIV